MAKNSLLDYSTTPSNNTDIAGIGIQGTSPINNFDDAFRELMAQMKTDLDYKEVYVSKSANYTAVARDNNASIHFTANATLSLTAAATLGTNWHLRVSAPASVTVTIDPNGSELINGAATLTLQPGYIADIWCDGSAFFANISADPTIVDYSTMFAAKGAYSSKSGNYTVVASDINDTIRFTATATAALTAAATLGANFNTTIWADVGATVTIDPDGAELVNGNATLILQPGQRAEIWGNGTAFFAKVSGDPLSGPQLQGYSFGLALSTNATDAANDVDIAAGAAASDTSPFNLMQLGGALTKRIDASWTVGNNQGGLDTGSVSAAATYYIWLIQRSDTLVVDALFSLSSTAPTMPAGYDRKSLRGSLVRTGGVNAKPAATGQSPVFVSTQQTFTAGASLVLSHGLGSQPTEVFLEFVCKSATSGYAVGDRVLMPSSTAGHDENYTNTGFSVSADATNIRVHFATNGIPLTNKGGGPVFFVGGTQFDVIVRGRV
ncbi:hypothetical protein [Agrobacterium cavarae]|uniref:hypothetical protein n=1 Tax=Agrobacterium cavarae TaxID=2528239 RepID=UPI002FDA2D6E